MQRRHKGALACCQYHLHDEGWLDTFVVRGGNLRVGLPPPPCSKTQAQGDVPPAGRICIAPLRLYSPPQVDCGNAGSKVIRAARKRCSPHPPRSLASYNDPPLPCDVDRRKRIVHCIGPLAVAEVLPSASACYHIVQMLLQVPFVEWHDLCIGLLPVQPASRSRAVCVLPSRCACCKMVAV